MKKIISIIIITLMGISSFAQGAFDKSIADISSDLAGKLSQKSKKKVVVLYVTDINKAPTVAGKYIADVISINIVNDTSNFQVFDRENLSGIAEAKKMISEGYIDVDKAKELGKILSVDGIIIGNYTVLSTTIKLTIKALDSNTGFVIAASMKDLPLDADAGALLGINTNSNRGFNNRPLNSNEQYNNPETVSKECEKKNIGDYCFLNNMTSSKTIIINQKTIAYDDHEGDSKVITISSGQTSCLYNLEAGAWNFYYYNSEEKETKTNCIIGQFLVEKCKSKTYTIK